MKRSSPTPDDNELTSIRQKKHEEYMKKKRQEQAKKEIEEQQKKFAAMMDDSSSDEESEDESDAQNICQICKEKIYKGDETLSCHEDRGPHTFHHKCIHPILQQNNNNNNKCPLCRSACLPPDEYIQKYPFIRPPDPAGVEQLVNNLIEQTYLLLNDRMLEIELDQFPLSQPHAHANGWKWDIFVCDSWYSKNNSEGYLPYGWKEVKETRNNETIYRYQDPNGSFTYEDGNEYENPRETGCGMYEPTEGVAFNRNQDNAGFIPLPHPFNHRDPNADNPCRYCNNQDHLNHSIDHHDPRWRQQEDAINNGKYFQWFLTNKWRAHHISRDDRHPNYDQANDDKWRPVVLNDHVTFICPKCKPQEGEQVKGCAQEIVLERRADDGSVIDADYMNYCPADIHEDFDGENLEYCGYHELGPDSLIFQEGLNNEPKIKTSDMYFDARGFLQIGDQIEKEFVDYDVWNVQREIWNNTMRNRDSDFNVGSEDYMKKMVYVGCDSGGDKNRNCPLPNPKYKEWWAGWTKAASEFRKNHDMTKEENQTELYKVVGKQFPNAEEPPKFVFIDTPNESGELKNIHTNEQFILCENEEEENNEDSVMEREDWTRSDIGSMHDEFYCPGCLWSEIIVSCGNDEECPNYDHENHAANLFKARGGMVKKVGYNWFCTDCAEKQEGGRKHRKHKKNTRRKKKKSRRRKTRGKRKKSKRRKTRGKRVKQRKTRHRKR